jgi:hypothetical protein
VIVPLLGRFKGEDHFRQHLLCTAAETDSGLRPRKWLDALVLLRQEQGLTSGPALCDADGYVTSQATMNEAFRSCLETVKEDTPDLFAPDQKVTDFDIDRSLRPIRETFSRAATDGRVGPFDQG